MLAWPPRLGPRWEVPLLKGLALNLVEVQGRGGGVRGRLMAAPQGIRGVNEWAVNVNEPCSARISSQKFWLLTAHTP